MARSALAGAVEKPPTTLQLCANWISYNPLQKTRFPESDITFHWIPIVSELQTIMNTWENQHSIVLGPIGSGKSYAAALVALTRRMSHLTPTVLIHDPEYILHNSKAIFYELVYAFADDSCPDDAESEEYSLHPVGMIKKAFLEDILRKKKTVHILKKLLTKLSEYCTSHNRTFTLIFDQVNANRHLGLNKSLHTFLFEDFPRYFEKSIGIVSATNELVFDRPPIPLLRLGGSLGAETIKGFTQSLLSIEASDNDVTYIQNCIGGSLLQLRRLLEGPGNTIHDKCASYINKAFREECYHVCREHLEWLKVYRQDNPNYHPYWDILTFCDTGTRVDMNMEAFEIFENIDNRFLTYDVETRTLRSNCPAAFNGVLQAIAEYPHFPNSSLVRELRSGKVAEAGCGLALEIVVRSVFTNAAEKTQNLQISNSEAVKMSYWITYASLESLPDKLASLTQRRDESYYTIMPLPKTFPAPVFILFCPREKRFLVFHLTPNDDYDDFESNLLSSISPDIVQCYFNLLISSFLGAIATDSQ